MGSAYYCYDYNGNMTDRQATNAACDIGGQDLTYDTENRLTQVISGTIATGYKYDGDGARVSKTITVSGVTTTTFYIGSHFEITSTGGQTGITKYYYFGSQRVAMRQGSSVTYLHSDHLGSSNVASNGSGALISRQTYFPFGAPRASDTAQMTAVTDFGFTGQKLDASDGLMYYGARYYDAALGRFTQPDTIIPNLYNPQSLNRYSYGLNNPLKYTDPTGHKECGGGEPGDPCGEDPVDPIDPPCEGNGCPDGSDPSKSVVTDQWAACEADIAGCWGKKSFTSFLPANISLSQFLSAMQSLRSATGSSQSLSAGQPKASYAPAPSKTATGGTGQVVSLTLLQIGVGNAATLWSLDLVQSSSGQTILFLTTMDNGWADNFMSPQGGASLTKGTVVGMDSAWDWWGSAHAKGGGVWYITGEYTVSPSGTKAGFLGGGYSQPFVSVWDYHTRSEPLFQLSPSFQWLWEWKKK